MKFIKILLSTALLYSFARALLDPLTHEPPTHASRGSLDPRRRSDRIDWRFVWMAAAPLKCRFHDEEHANLLNSMWLTAITFLCVGYGDIVPNTYCGRGITLTCGMVVSNAVTDRLLSTTTNLAWRVIFKAWRRLGQSHPVGGEFTGEWKRKLN